VPDEEDHRADQRRCGGEHDDPGCGSRRSASEADRREAESDHASTVSAITLPSLS
jgi:hypothetical protein